jgi:hypothetical protein
MNKNNLLRYLRLGPKERCIQVTAHKSFVELTLILETLLRKKYTGTKTNPTLGDYLCDIVGPKMFSNSQVYNKKARRIELIKVSLKHDYTKILQDIQTAEKSENKLAVAYQLAYRKEGRP